MKLPRDDPIYHGLFALRFASPVGTPKDHDMSETRDDCDEFTIYLHICTTGMPNTRTEMIAICL